MSILSFGQIYNLHFFIADVIDEENRVMKDLGELHLKEQHINMLFHSLKEETGDVLRKINDVVSALSPNASADPELKQIFANFSKAASSYSKMKNSLKPPSVSHFLPHLLIDNDSLLPLYHASKNRSGGTVYFLCKFLFSIEILIINL